MPLAVILANYHIFRLATPTIGRAMHSSSFLSDLPPAVAREIRYTLETTLPLLETDTVEARASRLEAAMAMLAAYPDAYEKVITEGSGPKMAKDAAAKVVLGEGGPGLAVYVGSYAPSAEHMPAYRYHFLTRSKPATHLQAFAHLDETTIKKSMPEPYRALLEYVSNNLKRD